MSQIHITECIVTHRGYRHDSGLLAVYIVLTYIVLCKRDCTILGFGHAGIGIDGIVLFVVRMDSMMLVTSAVIEQVGGENGYLRSGKCCRQPAYELPDIAVAVRHIHCRRRCGDAVPTVGLGDNKVTALIFAIAHCSAVAVERYTTRCAGRIGGELLVVSHPIDFGCSTSVAVPISRRRVIP